MNKRKKVQPLFYLFLLFIGLIVITSLFSQIDKLKNKIITNTITNLPTATPNPATLYGPDYTPAPAETIYEGNQSNNNWIEFTLDGCSANNFPLKYNLVIPGNWTITKDHHSFDDGNFIFGRNPPGNFTYQIKGDSGKFTIGCLSDGTKGGGCDLPRLTLTIDGKKVEACAGISEGKYIMATDYIDSTKAKSSTEFSSNGINMQTLNKIFSTFKFIE